MFETTFSIGPDLLEEEYQHVHHADSLRILEQGRLRYLDHIGLPQSELLASDCFLVLGRCDVRFLRELKQEDVVCTVEVEEIQEPSGFVLRQKLIKAPKRVAVDAAIQLIAMSGETRRKRSLPDELLEKLRRHSEES